MPISATILQGHRVASGLNGNPLFPGGTLRMQLPFFLAQGLDLSPYYPGTLNVSIAPWRYRVVRPRHVFPCLKWHPTEPAEDFSFFDVVVQLDAAHGGSGSNTRTRAPDLDGGEGCAHPGSSGAGGVPQAGAVAQPDAVRGLIYYPHPDTKPAHFQKPDVLELLLPWTEGLAYGQTLQLEAPPEQIVFERA